MFPLAARPYAGGALPFGVMGARTLCRLWVNGHLREVRRGSPERGKNPRRFRPLGGGRAYTPSRRHEKGEFRGKRRGSRAGARWPPGTRGCRVVPLACEPGVSTPLRGRRRRRDPRDGYAAYSRWTFHRLVGKGGEEARVGGRAVAQCPGGTRADQAGASRNDPCSFPGLGSDIQGRCHEH